MRITLPGHSNREDIQAIHGDIMTLLSDADVNVGDEIFSPHKFTLTHYGVFHVEEIKEKRRPMGNGRMYHLTYIRFVSERKW